MLSSLRSNYCRNYLVELRTNKIGDNMNWKALEKAILSLSVPLGLVALGFYGGAVIAKAIGWILLFALIIFSTGALYWFFDDQDKLNGE